MSLGDFVATAFAMVAVAYASYQRGRRVEAEYWLNRVGRIAERKP